MTGNSRIPTTEVIITSIFIKTRPKASFFPWFKVNNLKLELRMTLKFYTAVTERDKTKGQKVFALNLISAFLEVPEEKMVGEFFFLFHLEMS